jgi:hypothetical protein
MLIASSDATGSDIFQCNLACWNSMRIFAELAAPVELEFLDL